MDIKAKIEELVEKIKKNPALLKKFNTEPVKVVEELVGIDLPDEIIEKVVDGIKAQICASLEELEPALSMHDFRITDGDRRINLIFDLVVPFSVSPEKSVLLVEELSARIRALDPRYCTVIRVESDYTEHP